MNLDPQNVCEEIIERSMRCGKILEPAPFTISEKVFEKLSKGKTKGEYSAKEAVISDLEEKWHKKEKCIEVSHAKAWKYTKEDIDEVEQRLLKAFEPLAQCSMEQPLIDCIKKETRLINCRDIVQQYISCIEEYTKKAIERMAPIITCKRRPKPKDFHH
ncbi:hypothetical protein O3M35_000906 [Rhynocoris fuscipes]|uniref:MICOS complex subunit MIC19 n=1 Tax=Rhynocoris fuscipes TaxID=488301 RepID=A0AAW1DQ13_9HEMI